MKKKKILIIVFTLFIYFGLISNLQAERKKYPCYYSSQTEDITAFFTLDLKSSSTEASNATITIKGKKEVKSVQNWSSPDPRLDNVEFLGSVYYDKNRICPPHALLFKTKFGYELYVSDGPSLELIGTSFREAFTTLKSGYPKVLNRVQTQEVESKEEPTSCLDFEKEPYSEDKFGGGSCEHNNYFACVWNETEYGGYCNADKLQYVKCGDAYNIPKEIPNITSFVVNLLKIATPIILILVSIITLVKALASSKEDEIKKAQSSLVKKLIAAALVFFIVSIVQFVILKVAESSEEGNIKSCLSCFLNNDCSDNIYYKTNVYGTDICTYLDGAPLDCE